MNLLASILASATLAWDASGEPGVAGYRVEEQVNAIWSVAWDVSTTQTIVTLSDHFPRAFRVRAFNSAGEGPPSNEIILTLVTLQASTDLSAWNDIATAVIESTPAAFFRLLLPVSPSPSLLVFPPTRSLK